MQHKTKTFLDQDFKLKMSLFDNFKFDEIVSLDHLRLWCAVQNIEFDRDLVVFLLAGSVFIKNLHDILIEAIQTSNDIDEYVNSVEFVESIYKLYSPLEGCYSRTYEAKEIWLDHCTLEVQNAYYCTGLEEDEARRYVWLKLLDRKFPLLLAKFYSKHSRELHKIDEKFVVWLFKKFKAKSTINSLFAKIYAAMEKEATNMRNYNMFMR